VTVLPEPRRELTALGELLENARSDLRITTREAARRARISHGRWSQVVTGKQPKAGRMIPVNPRERTVVAMALAVQADPGEALAAAGFTVTPTLAALVDDVQRELTANRPITGADDLAAEVERIGKLDLPADDRLRIIRTVMGLYEEQLTAGDGPADATA
jgi:transcriptional regulator with XRE-family HTH domain